MLIIEAQNELNYREHNPLNIEEKVEEEEGEEESESCVVRSLYVDGSKIKYCVSTNELSSCRKHTSTSTNKEDQG
jgi:hypothetical protein